MEVNAGFSHTSTRGTNPKADGQTAPRGVPEFLIQDEKKLLVIARERFQVPSLRRAWALEFGMDAADTDNPQLFTRFLAVCKLWQERMKKDSSVGMQPEDVPEIDAFTPADLAAARQEGFVRGRIEGFSDGLKYPDEFEALTKEKIKDPAAKAEFEKNFYGKPLEEVKAALPK